MDAESTQKLEDLYLWIDEMGDVIPFTRVKKKNLARDFSDGVLVAELLKHFFPKQVELHNYSAASSVAHKVENWKHLNKKVLPKLKIHLTTAMIEDVARANQRAVEHFLMELRDRIELVYPSPEKRLSEEYSSEIVDIAIPTGTGENELHKMVPAGVLEKALAESTAKDGKIFKLEQQVLHLESMLELKDSRIHDLTNQLFKLQS